MAVAFLEAVPQGVGKMDLVSKFLSEDDKLSIKEAVASVESVSSGEVVPYIASSSFEYRYAMYRGASLFTALVSVVLVLLNVFEVKGFSFDFFKGSWGFLSHFSSVFNFFIIVLFLYWVFYMLLLYCPVLRKLFIRKKEMVEEVEEGALKAFYNNKIYETRDRTGILIYISLYEKMVVVIADKGINEKVEKDYWNSVRDIIIKNMKVGNGSKGICDAILFCKDNLEKFFPVKADDTNELSYLIIEK